MRARTRMWGPGPWPALAAVAWLSACPAGPSAHPPADEVEALLEALASPVPPPHPDQDRSVGSEPVPGRPGHFRFTGFATGYEHPLVAEATRKLVAMGTGIYPRLVARLDDERYSFSRVSAAWVNYSVGVKVREILAAGIEVHAVGYKSRDCLQGSAMMPTFAGFLAERDPTAWARAAAGSTQARLRREYLDWAVAQERACGFKDESEEHAYLEPYLEEIRRLEKEPGRSPN